MGDCAAGRPHGSVAHLHPATASDCRRCGVDSVDGHHGRVDTCSLCDATEDHRRAEKELTVMFTWISQTLAVTALNLRTIPQRLGSSGVAIIGIAGVVVVFVSVLSIAAGFT